jgi:hypothetical protein
MGCQNNEKSKKSQFNLPQLPMRAHKNLPSQMPYRKALPIRYFLQQFNKIFIKAPTPNNSHCRRALSPQPNQQNDRSCWEALAPPDFWFGRENILCRVTSGVKKIGVIASVFMTDSADSGPPYLSSYLGKMTVLKSDFWIPEGGSCPRGIAWRARERKNPYLAPLIGRGHSYLAQGEASVIEWKAIARRPLLCEFSG